MKIAIVCPTSHNKPYTGDCLKKQALGASWTGVINLGRELYNLGHEVLVLNHCPEPGVYDGVKYLTNVIPEDIQNKRHVQRALNGIDALIVNRAGNIDWHDCVEQWCDYTGYRKYLWCHDSGGAHKGQPEKFALYDKVISVSNWLNQINIDANYDISPDYFISIPLGIDTEIFAPSDSPVRTNICFLGAFVNPRRPQLAIEAFVAARRMRPDLPLKLHMIGSAAVWGGPPEGTSKEFQAVMQDAMRHAEEFKDDIKFYGDIPNLAVPSILENMGVMVYPTITETCGVGIMEAQACGVPTIVPSDCMFSAVQERIYHTETGVVRNFARMDEVAAAIIDMATNDHAYNKIRNQARGKVVRENDWKIIAKRWEKEVLQAPSAIEIVERKEALKSKTVGVGILSFQNRPLLEKCVESLKKTADMPIKIVVWDNNSAGYGCDNVAWLRANHPDVVVMESDQNRYCTISRNGIIEYFRTHYPEMEYMLFSDMDVIFKHGFLSPMVEIMENNPDCGIVAYPTANCGFRPDDRGVVSEVMSICNLHRLKSFDEFPNPNRPFDETFKVYSFDSWVCQTLNLMGWYTYLVMGRVGYDHIGGQINQFLPTADAVKSADVKYWQSLAGKMSIKKRWEDKNSADYITIGNKLKEEKEYDGALREYVEGISRYPDDSTLHYCLGNLHREKGDYKIAIEAYKNSIAKNPHNFDAIYALEDARNCLSGLNSSGV